MAASIAAAAIAGTAATAAYLDAKYHITHDVSAGVLANPAANALAYTMERIKQDKLLMYHFLEDHAQGAASDAPFLDFEGRSWTYRQFYEQVQRVANWLMNDLGVKKGEMIAMTGPNTAEYLLLHFALDGVGASVAYINCNLTGAPLVHCVKVCDSRFLIADRDIENLVGPCIEDLAKSAIQTVYFDQALFASLSDNTPIPRQRNSGMNPEATKSLIYTSGTTGLPKGVILTVARMLATSRSVALYLRLTPRDKFYTCLPLYHGAGQGLCLLPVVYAGASMTLGRKFSHRTFWPEVSASRANRIQYVGELCRYLVNAPPHPLERAHCVEEAWGNGMRADVWEPFRQRFGIPIIHELYAATDGLGATFNRNRGPFTRNAIGLRGLLWHMRQGDVEVRGRIDPDTENLIRSPTTGFVERAGPTEPGEVLHAVDPAMSSKVFRGYYGNAASTSARWLRDAFAKGDLWFRSGDVMRVDAEGRVYFVDRLGDTFRWKSENVSTAEVADVLGLFRQVAECSVYGIKVPNADGRCGCATLVPVEGMEAEKMDMAALAKHLQAALPRYAVPVFLRVAPQLSYTGTFKIQKGQAKREGIDLDLIAASSADRVFWLPPGGSAYVPFAQEDWGALKGGKVRL